MAFLHEEDGHNNTDERKEYGAEDDTRRNLKSHISLESS